MKNLDQLFIPYELAVIAKEKGFNDPCLRAFDNKQLSIGGFLLYDRWREFNNSDERYVLQPLYHQTVTWFRTKHKIKICEDQETFPCVVFHIIEIEKGTNGSKFVMHEKYFEALNKAIEQAFKLI